MTKENKHYVDIHKITPEYLLLISKHFCFLNLIHVKFREIFKERYYLETKKTYKNNPLHGEFIIHMLGKEKFNTFDTEMQADIKTGIVNRWSSDVLYVLLLSYSYKGVPIDKLNKENKIIERIRYIDINDRQCECHSSVVKLKAYRKELTELYESIGGKQEHINNALDRYNGYKNISVVGCKNIESIKTIDKGDEYYKNGKFEDAHEQYIKAFMLCKSEDYDYHDGFSLISTILLKLSSSHYNQYCRSIIINKNNDDDQEIKFMIGSTLYISFDKIQDCFKYSSHYSPSCSEIWIKKAFYNSRLGTDSVIYRSYNYLKVASLLEPNNLQFKDLTKQLVKEFNFISTFMELIYRCQTEFNIDDDQLFHQIAYVYSNSIPYKFQIPFDIQNEFKSKSNQITNGVPISSKYYNQGIDNKSNGKFDLAFKSFCFSILAAENESATTTTTTTTRTIPLPSYYELGLMYAYGNSSIQINYDIGMSLFYKCAIDGIDLTTSASIEKPTMVNQIGRIESIYELCKILIEGKQYFRCIEIALYWLRRIASIELNDYIGSENRLESYNNAVNEKNKIAKVLLSLGYILYNIDEEELNGLGKKITGLFDNDGNRISEALKVLSKGYLKCNSNECLQLIEKYFPYEVSKLKLNNNNHNHNHHHCHSYGCIHVLGKVVYNNDIKTHFKSIQFDYIKIKKLALHPEQSSIQSKRIIEILDLVNQFLNQFKSTSSLLEKEKSIQYLADAFMYKELYVINLPTDVMTQLKSYLIKSIASNRYPSKSLSIVWIALNLLIDNNFKNDDEFEKSNNEIIKFIKQSINRFPKEIIFKFFSSIYNRFNGDLDIALNDLNQCIKLSTTKSTKTTKTTTTSINNNNNNNITSDIYYYFKADTLFHLNRKQESIDTYNEYLNKSSIDARWRMESYYTIAHLTQLHSDLILAKESESKSLYCFLPWISSKF